MEFKKYFGLDFWIPVAVMIILPVLIFIILTHPSRLQNFSFTSIFNFILIIFFLPLIFILPHIMLTKYGGRGKLLDFMLCFLAVDMIIIFLLIPGVLILFYFFYWLAVGMFIYLLIFWHIKRKRKKTESEKITINPFTASAAIIGFVWFASEFLIMSLLSHRFIVRYLYVLYFVILVPILMLSIIGYVKYTDKANRAITILAIINSILACLLYYNPSHDMLAGF